MVVYVVTWSYWDKTSSGIVDVFYSLEAAEHMVRTLEKHSHDKYELHEKEVIGYVQNNTST